jgi:hypothetical protein
MKATVRSFVHSPQFGELCHALKELPAGISNVAWCRAYHRLVDEGAKLLLSLEVCEVKAKFFEMCRESGNKRQAA